MPNNAASANDGMMERRAPWPVPLESKQHRFVADWNLSTHLLTKPHGETCPRPPKKRERRRRARMG